ncbi:HSP90 family protein [Archangium sp. Cb G35]|uniref:HSP90 family protein n=1 Tax=Archangium sp. Cb G35 TaxID=1920190 RepID=UPI0009359C6D|nr:HSP90 family protein [Archangium sp. Cb G35]OJT23890.1 HSP90 family protein [Archangium sp. Cb G35]
MDHRFQVNLRGVIDLLSHHLYSTPGVFVRELLQNATDAIRARRHLEPGHPGSVRMELIEKQDGGLPTLLFSDDGVGLTEEELHRFLATIGESSKRETLEARRNDFIGQFGIGLLSCFMVCDELLVVTRSAKGDGRTMEWRGRHDGTYSVRPSEHPLAHPGTQVFLAARADAAEYFTAERVRQLAVHYGGLLPFPIHLTVEGRAAHLNPAPPPWRREYESAGERRAALLAYGREVFGQDFVDCIPLRAEAGQVEGVAFVLPFSPHFNARQKHRVYLKDMLLSESAENLLPEWAFFVRCVVNAQGLRPTASREAFYEDTTLARARESLGQCLRQYLVDLAHNDPRTLQRLIALHGLSVKALALDDDDFYRLVIHWLPFETTLGMMTLGHYRQSFPSVRYVNTLDAFRQVARVAAAQGLCILNGAYTHDTALLEKLPRVMPDAQVELFSAAQLPQGFEELTHEEREMVARLRQVATEALEPFRCEVSIKKFLPPEVPTLYGDVDDGAFRRDVERAREETDELYASVLEGALTDSHEEERPQLCFNLRNPVVRRLTRVRDTAQLKLSVEMLYVQALLLGHRPLNAREMGLLNRGLLGLIAARLDDDEGTGGMH